MLRYRVRSIGAGYGEYRREKRRAWHMEWGGLLVRKAQ